MRTIKHIVFESGGIGSYMTTKRVIEQHGKENVIRLFTDTLIEDEDLYRFQRNATEYFGVPLTYVADGRDPWDVFKDVRWIGNSRIAQCSHVLKQDSARKWLKENYGPDECILYLGIDWTEEHRTAAPKKNWSPYKVEFPMCQQPYVTRDEMLKELENDGIEAPRLYKLGFAHNNCGGFCVRGGQGHFIQLLKTMPDRFAHHEKKEQEMRDYLGKDVSILTRQKNGVKEQLTLKQLREEFEQQPEQLDLFDIGGCGCFAV